MAKGPKYSQRELLEHIVELCDTIRDEIGAKGLAEFETDRNLADATAYRLQAIGEACIKLNDGVKSAYDVPWTEIIGMRQIQSHDYLAISRRIVWTTATSNLSDLHAACRSAIEKESGE